MKTGYLTKDDTHCVRPFDERPAEVPDLLWSEIVSPSSVQIDSVRARLADVGRQEEKRHRLLRILQRKTPPWNPADHPEIEKAGGAAAWVKELRREAEQGFEKRTRVKERG